eukprot:2792-Prorocentrum_minimum.AAC.1
MSVSSPIELLTNPRTSPCRPLDRSSTSSSDRPPPDPLQQARARAEGDRDIIPPDPLLTPS